MVLQVAAQPSQGLVNAEDVVEREPCTVRAVVSFYGVYDFVPMVTDASPGSLVSRLFGTNKLDGRVSELLKRYSPIYHVHADMPPVLLVHGTDERLWQQGVSLQQKLLAVEVRHKLHAVQGGPHGMENWEGHPEWTGYKQVVVDWLRLTLR